MNLNIDWFDLAQSSDPWGAMSCLYAYIAPRSDEIPYVGKAWGVTVRRRWVREAKSDFG